MSELEQIVEFNQGHDCIKFECIHKSSDCKPNSGWSHGKHGLEIKFVVKGDKGAIQFLLYTGWIPQYSKRDSISGLYINNWGSFVLPADLGYHSKEPMYEGQDTIVDSCVYCDGLPCYYDGSSLNASDAMYTLVNGGDKALWEFLKGFYNHIFYNGSYPKLAEYPMPIRSMK